jgi:hypothetical protein
MTQQELMEADRCFQHVCDLIRIDKVSPRNVLFGSTLADWLNGIMRITVVCEPPGLDYVQRKGKCHLPIR